MRSIKNKTTKRKKTLLTASSFLLLNGMGSCSNMDTFNHRKGVKAHASIATTSKKIKASALKTLRYRQRQNIEDKSGYEGDDESDIQPYRLTKQRNKKQEDKKELYYKKQYTYSKQSDNSPRSISGEIKELSGFQEKINHTQDDIISSDQGYSSDSSNSSNSSDGNSDTKEITYEPIDSQIHKADTANQGHGQNGDTRQKECTLPNDSKQGELIQGEHTYENLKSANEPVYNTQDHTTSSDQGYTSNSNDSNSNNINHVYEEIACKPTDSQIHKVDTANQGYRQNGDTRQKEYKDLDECTLPNDSKQGELIQREYTYENLKSANEPVYNTQDHTTSSDQGYTSNSNDSNSNNINHVYEEIACKPIDSQIHKADTANQGHGQNGDTRQKECTSPNDSKQGELIQKKHIDENIKNDNEPAYNSMGPTIHNVIPNKREATNTIQLMERIKIRQNELSCLSNIKENKYIDQIIDLMNNIEDIQNKMNGIVDLRKENDDLLPELLKDEFRNIKSRINIQYGLCEQAIDFLNKYDWLNMDLPKTSRKALYNKAKTTNKKVCKLLANVNNLFDEVDKINKNDSHIQPPKNTTKWHHGIPSTEL